MERRWRGEACKESSANKVSSNSLVRVKVKVRERMGGGLVRQSESEWVKGFRVGKVSIYTRVFFFLILYIRVGFRPGMPNTRTRPELALGFLMKTQTHP